MSMTFERLDAKAHVAAIDKANAYSTPERGFNTTKVTVRSDRPTKFNLWDPGTRVGWQTVTAAPLTYTQRRQAMLPLAERKLAPETVFTDVGSTFHKCNQHGATRNAGYPVNASLGRGTLADRVFGNMLGVTA